MSDKEVFEAHVHRLVAWLRVSAQPDIDAQRDIRPQDYSDNFVQWLVHRFPHRLGRHERWNNTPEAWISSATAARESLYEIRTSRGVRLMRIEMSEAAHTLRRHHTHIDAQGVLHIEFNCAKHSADDEDDGAARASICLTNIGEGTNWMHPKCEFGGITTEGEEMEPTPCDMDDDAWGFNGGGCPCL
jgi:hypothetical protein